MVETLKSRRFFKDSHPPLNDALKWRHFMDMNSVTAYSLRINNIKTYFKKYLHNLYSISSNSHPPFNDVLELLHNCRYFFLVNDNIMTFLWK